MRISLSTLGALGALHFLAVSAADYCVGTCTNTLRDKFSQFSCSSAEDGACLCRNQSFLDGIRDCSTSSCGATEAEMNTYLSTNFCLGVISASSAASAAVSSAAPASAAAPTSQTPSTTAIPTTKAEATSKEAWSSTAVQTSVSVSTTTAAASTAPVESSSAAGQSSATASASQTEATASGTSNGTGAGTAATGTSAANKAESTQDSENNKSTGLSIAAQAGIGVGVGAAVLAVLSLGLFCVLKSRRHEDEQKPQRRGIGLAISEPLPGGGRVYGSSDGAFGEKGAYDMEVITNRYEDMVPRHTPRTMV